MTTYRVKAVGGFTYLEIIMKAKVFAIFVFFFMAFNTQAEIHSYTGDNAQFPSESTPEGLPESFPCVRTMSSQGANLLFCAWHLFPRDISIYSQEDQTHYTISNQFNGICRNNKCRANSYPVGNWPEDINIVISIWYTVGMSSDGKPVAYRNDVMQQVSYAQAGKNLVQFYSDSGISDEAIKGEMSRHYTGGYLEFEKDSVALRILEETKDYEWCPDKDYDNCYDG